MSELIIPPGYANLHYQFLNDGATREQSFAIGMQITDGFTDYEGLVEDMYDLFISNFPVTVIANTGKLSGTHLVVGNDGPPIVVDHEETTDGTAGWSVPSTQVSLLVKKRTAFGGVQFRGRLYMPSMFVQDTEVDYAGTVTGSRVTAINASWATWRTNGLLVTGVDDFVLLHSTPQAGPAPDPTPIVSLTCDSIVATQRRRLR